MARIKCVCGEVMWNGMVPNDIVYNVFSDRRASEIDESVNFDMLRLWDMRSYEVWKCPSCGRLFVFDPDCSKAIAVYRLEDTAEIG